MIIEFLFNKIYSLFFVLALLNIVMNLYKFIRAWANTENDEPNRYKITKTSVLYIGLALAYVISSLFYGITM